VGIDHIGPMGPYRFNAPNQQRTRAAEQLAAPSEGAREDSINLSSAARELAEASPEQRAELVRRIQRQVESGTYSVDPAALARQMVERGDL